MFGWTQTHTQDSLIHFDTVSTVPRADEFYTGLRKRRSFQELVTKVKNEKFKTKFNVWPENRKRNRNLITLRFALKQFKLSCAACAVLGYVNSCFLWHLLDLCLERKSCHVGLGGVVGLKLPLALAAAVRVPYTTSPLQRPWTSR